MTFRETVFICRASERFYFFRTIRIDRSGSVRDYRVLPDARSAINISSLVKSGRVVICSDYSDKGSSVGVIN